MIKHTNEMKECRKDSLNIKLGVILSYIGLGISFIGSIFITNRVLNYIGDYNYGLFSFVNSITTWLSIVSSALSVSFLRFATIENNVTGNVGKINTIYFKLLLILGFFVFFLGMTTVLFLYALGVPFAQYSWRDSQLIYVLFGLSIINISLTMPTCIFSLYVSYKKKFVFARCLSILITVINFTGHFLIAYFSRNIAYIAIFTIIITIVSFFFNYFYCKKSLKISFFKTALTENKPLVKSILVFSSFLLLNSIVDQINSNVDKTLLGLFSIPENVAVYQMGQQFSTYLVTMSIAVSGVFAPTIHQMVVDNKREELNNLYLKISKIQTIILCLFVFGFLSCGHDFILWWIGPKRVDAYYVGIVLMVIDLCPLTMNASIEIQRAENKHKFRALLYFTVALLNVLLSILFLNIFPSNAAIAACLAGSVVARICSHWIAMNIYNKRIIKLPVERYLFTLAKYMVVGLLVFLIVFALKEVWICKFSSYLIRFLLEGFLFVVVFVGVTFGIDNKTIFEMIRRKITQ